MKVDQQITFEHVSPVVDRSVLRRNIGGDIELLGELVGILEQELPGLQADFQKALQNHDGTTLAGVAHRTKGSLIALGARCAVLAEDIEISARAGYAPDLAGRVATLEREIELVAPALQSILYEGEI